MENDVSTTALMNQTPKIACLPNGPYYLFNDMTAAPVPNLRHASNRGARLAVGAAQVRHRRRGHVIEKVIRPVGQAGDLRGLIHEGRRRNVILHQIAPGLGQWRRELLAPRGSSSSP